MKTLRVGFFGDGPWAHNALQHLFGDSNIQVGLVVGRNRTMDTQLEVLAVEGHVPFRRYQNINSKEAQLELADKSLDLFVSMSFDQIFQRRTFSIPTLGTINCHAGKLPFYRGRNILNWALINDEPEFGGTVFFVDEGIDTGDIILQKTYPITDEDDYKSLLNRSARYCADVLFQAIKLIQKGCASPVPQSSIHPTGFYCCSRQAGDERINWNQRSRDIFNFVRGLSCPELYATTRYRDRDVKIKQVKLIPEAPKFCGIPGAVLGASDSSFLVKTQDTYVEVIQWSGLAKPRVGERLR